MKTNSSIHDPRHMTIIAILKSARVKQRLTQDALAKKLGVTRIYISKTEIGDRNLSVIELLDYCRALDIDVYSIIASINEEAVPENIFGADDFMTGYSIGYLHGKGMTPIDNPISAKIVSRTGKLKDK